jgi:hypothetical protein
MPLDPQHTRNPSRAVWRLQVLMQMGPQLAAAASLPADISVESGRHGGLRSWTPEEALAEGVPPNHVPRSVRSPCLACFPADVSPTLTRGHGKGREQVDALL